MAKQRSRWRRRALVALGLTAVSVPATWVAIHEVPGFGPALADGVRAVFGPKPVAWAEDTAYDLQDRYNRWRYQDAPPAAFWEAPSASSVPSTSSEPEGPAPELTRVLTAGSPSGVASAAPAAPVVKDFPPPNLEPPVQGVAAPGDGVWIAMPETAADGEAPAMYKAIVHPDAKRSFAAVAIVAIDLRRIDLHLVAGTSEPSSATVPPDHRPGAVPKSAWGDLVAAFNGGFKAVHGHWGMMLDGETFLAPRDAGCTVALYRDGSLRIGSWPALKDSEKDMAGYRQTPPCLLEDGRTNAGLDVEYNRNWGSTVSGETVIRRSSIGLDKAGHTLFYGLGEAVTAQALSHGMKPAAEHAAQLDVNYSYPRFLVYKHAPAGDAPRIGSALIPGIKYTSGEYTRDASPRDFFYLTRHRASS